MCTSRTKINEYMKIITERNAISSALKGLEKKSFCMPLFPTLEEGGNFFIYILYNLWEWIVPIVEKSDSLFHSTLSILKGHNINKRSMKQAV